MHSAGQLAEVVDARDLVRSWRLPVECIAPQDQHLVDVYRYWSGCSEGGLIPARRRIDPIEMKAALGWIHLCDVRDPNPENYQFTLWGSKVTLDRYRNFASTRIGDYPSVPYRDLVMKDYWQVVYSGVPAYQQVIASIDFKLYAYGRLVLPLSDDGRKVDRLLICVNERPRDTFPERVLGLAFNSTLHRTGEVRRSPIAPADPAGRRGSGDRTLRVINGGRNKP